jgi:FtsH-binding integral membrane protein
MSLTRSAYKLDSQAFGDTAVDEKTYLQMVFSWMFLALAITSGVAILFYETGGILQYFQHHQLVFFLSLGVQLLLVFAISAAINHISAQVAALLFCLYAATTGFVFSIFIAYYTTASLIGAFAGACGVFAGMALYGYTTSRDLSKFGGILIGALFGMIAASVAYIFIGGSTLNLLLGFAGVIIFSGLTAYDMQKIKSIGRSGLQKGENEQKAAIFGALRLYLDFINLFISLLRIFGESR